MKSPNASRAAGPTQIEPKRIGIESNKFTTYNALDCRFLPILCLKNTSECDRLGPEDETHTIAHNKQRHKMTTEHALRSVAPEALASTRAIAHRAVQHLTRAARANLDAAPDDSHSNLGWDKERQAFISHSMNDCTVGLTLAPLTLFVSKGNTEVGHLALAGKSDADATAWIDERLGEVGLKPASSVSLPYELPSDVAAVEAYAENSADDNQFSALAAWFHVASESLNTFADANSTIEPGPSPVRCWPHHFDIATYVALETGDPETARRIGVGMSPGDTGYNEPYLYINPWPYLDADNLPEAVKPGHWHKEGYVGLIATATELTTCDTVSDAIPDFITGAFSSARKARGF